MAETVEDYKVIKTHRFRVSTGEEEADHALIMVTGVSLEDNALFLEYYACQEMLKLITSRSGFEHLLLALVDDKGDPLVDVVLNGVMLRESGVGNLGLDVTEEEVVKLVAVYEYESHVVSVTSRRS